MAPLENHIALVQWVTSNGGFCHENIIVAHDSTRSFHLQVKLQTSIPTSVSLLRCPMDCVLTVLNAFDTSPFSCHGTSFPSKFLYSQSSYLIQYFFLMEQYLLGDESWWAPYIRTLGDPEELPDYVPFEESDLPWINGTNLEPALKSQFDRWRDIHSTGVQLLTHLNWTNAVEGRYTWSVFSYSPASALQLVLIHLQEAFSMGSQAV